MSICGSLRKARKGSFGALENELAGISKRVNTIKVQNTHNTIYVFELKRYVFFLDKLIFKQKESRTETMVSSCHLLLQSDYKPKSFV